MGCWPCPQAPPSFARYFSVTLKNWEEPGNEANELPVQCILECLCQASQDFLKGGSITISCAKCARKF